MTLSATDRLALYTIEAYASENNYTCNPSIKVDGIVDSSEMKLFHDAMEKRVSTGLKLTKDQKAAYEFAKKTYEFTSRSAQFTLTYWTGVTDDVGQKIYGSRPAIPEPFIKADVFGTDPDGKTTVSEIISERIALSWDCEVLSAPLGIKALEISFCFFNPITPEGRFFDLALYTFSENLYLIAFGEVLKLYEFYNPTIPEQESEPKTEEPKKPETEFLIYYPEQPTEPIPPIVI